jgi:hypothetical protein
MPVDDPDAQVPKPVLDAFFRQMKMANDEKVSRNWLLTHHRRRLVHSMF